MSGADFQEKMRDKRLANELKKLRKDPVPFAETVPDEKNKLLWYFLLVGPKDSDFEGGVYIGKIEINPGYPKKAPDFYFHTPNGRFLTDRKICLSNSGYHQSEWLPSWGIKTMIIGIMSIMLDDNENGISHIHTPKAERQGMAKSSHDYNMTHYKEVYTEMLELIKERPDKSNPFKELEAKKPKDDAAPKEESKPTEVKTEKKPVEPPAPPAVEKQAEKKKPVKKKVAKKSKKVKELVNDPPLSHGDMKKMINDINQLNDEVDTDLKKVKNAVAN